MAGVWTKTGVEKLKRAIANGQPLTFTIAKLNMSDAPVGSVELNAGLTELPNPYGSFVPVLEYDEATKVLYAEVVVPPLYGFPSDKYVNGIGLYIDDSLAYVEQLVPRRIPNNGYTRFKLKINLENYQGGIDVNLISFSYNAGESETVTISADSSYSRAFSGEVKEVKVFLKEDDVYKENSGEIEVSLSEDFKTVTLKNTTSDDVQARIFYLVATNPIPANITLNDIKKIASPIYVGSQPPPPDEGYKLFYYPESADLYFANTDKNRWDSVTEDIRRKVEIFWLKVVEMQALDLSGRLGLYSYLVDDCSTWELWNVTQTTNVEHFKGTFVFEAFRGSATLVSKKIVPDGPESYPTLDLAIDVLGNRTDKIKVFYDAGAGEIELKPQTRISLTNFSEVFFKLKVDGDPSLRLSPALYGFVIVTDKPVTVG